MKKATHFLVFVFTSCVYHSGEEMRVQETRAKTINVFRACLGAQLTICAQK